MSGTDVGYADTRIASTSTRRATKSSTPRYQPRYAPTPVLRHVRCCVTPYWDSRRLSCYARSGTDLIYLNSGTDRPLFGCAVTGYEPGWYQCERTFARARYSTRPLMGCLGPLGTSLGSSRYPRYLASQHLDRARYPDSTADPVLGPEMAPMSLSR
eukprot:3210227-Rhodomonas_salina.1